MAPKRITGRKLQRLRDQLFRSEPLCRACLERGIVTAATERDHIVPLEQGGADSRENTQALCHDCHLDKTARDRGYRKRRVGVDGWPVEEAEHGNH